MELTIRMPSDADRVLFLGAGDRNLKMIREALGVRIAARDDTVRLSGESQAVTAACCGGPVTPKRPSTSAAWRA